MKNKDSDIQNAIGELVGFLYYIYELYVFLISPTQISVIDSSVILFSLRFTMLLFALPLLYLFRMGYYFDWASINDNDFVQVKMFYYSVYVVLTLLLIFRAVDTFF